MSDEMTFNPLADLPSDMGQDNVREYGAALVRNGMRVDEVNRHLATRGAAPLATDSLEMAEFTRDRLLADGEFAARFMRGEPEAMTKINLLDARIAKGGSKLMDRDPAPGDYNLKISSLAPNARAADMDKFSGEMAQLAADLKLPESSAQALVEQHLHAVKQTSGMTEEERETFAREQTERLQNVLGANAPARIDAASAVLRRISGRPLDLAKIVQSNGASAALTLLHQAEYVAATKHP